MNSFKEDENQNELSFEAKKDEKKKKQSEIEMQNATNIPIKIQLTNVELEKMKLNPIQKFAKFGRFPFKICYHALLLILISSQILIYIAVETEYSRIQINMLKYNIAQLEETEFEEVAYDLLELQEELEYIFNAVEELGENSFSNLYSENTGYFLNVMYSIDRLDQNEEEYDVEYELNELPFDVNDLSSLKQFIQEVDEMNLEVTNLIMTAYENTTQSYCANWTYSILMDYRSRSAMNYAFDASRKKCNHEFVESRNVTYNFNFFGMLVSVGVLIFAVFSMFLNWKYFLRSIDHLIRVKAAKEIKQQISEERKKRLINNLFQGRKRSIDQIDPLNDHIQKIHDKIRSEISILARLRLFDSWLYVQLFTNLLQILGALTLIINYFSVGYFNVDTCAIVNGIAAFLTWTYTMKYIEYSHSFTTLSTVVSSVGKDIVAMIYGIIPIFVIFIVLAVSTFNELTIFQSVKQSIITFVSLMFGDIVNATFLQLETISIGGVALEFFYLVVFYTSMQNVFVMIVMEGNDKVNDENMANQKKTRLRKKLLSKYQDTDTEEEAELAKKVKETLKKKLFDHPDLFLDRPEINIPEILSEPNSSVQQLLMPSDFGENIGFRKKTWHTVTISAKALKKYSIHEETEPKDKKSKTNEEEVTEINFEDILFKLKEKSGKLAVRIDALEEKLKTKLIPGAIAPDERKAYHRDYIKTIEYCRKLIQYNLSKLWQNVFNFTIIKFLLYFKIL